MRLFFIYLFIVLSGATASAQVGINTPTPVPSAALDVTSTDKGFLPPRMTTEQRDLIASPAAGLTIYNTTGNCLQWWNGKYWYDGCGVGNYPASSVFCAGATKVVNVTNPNTGKIWMDRNLGSTQVATSSTDANSYGDLYQWGRRSDGHQCRTSQTTTSLSSTDQPLNNNFILTISSPDDWRSPQNGNLWQGVNGVNNPCPSGYRLPTEAELNAERLSWSNNNSSGAFGSPLKLPLSGFRITSIGSLSNVDSDGYYWSSTVSGTLARYLRFSNSLGQMVDFNRANGLSVRCISDVTSSGSITNLNCATATNNDTLTAGIAASGVSSSVPYTGGNGGTHYGQTVTSTGVTGLIAALVAGSFANGAGSLTYTITGTPSGSGTASFALNIGGQSCTLTRTVNAAPPPYPPSSVFCASGASAIVNVANPSTGRIWMDRNLGSTQVATSSTDASSYGDLYQWGRRSDGHQCRNSSTTTILSSTDQPGNGNFILTSSSPFDWRSPQNDNLWQGVNGVNNPCPSGYRIPTSAELDAERLSWSSNNNSGAFGSPLKLPMAGIRNDSNGSISSVGTAGYYWSSTVSGFISASFFFTNSNASVNADFRGKGRSVRCISDVTPTGSITTLNCATATNNGTLIEGIAASAVSSSVPYTGGNGGTHNGQTVPSIGVTGLTATLVAGGFAIGSGSLNYTITGTPSGSGTASFALNIGGQSCTLSRTVNTSGSITTLNCATATNNGTLTSGNEASGVSSNVPYTGGNGGTHYGQTVTSTGVTGLTATLVAGSFATGSGSLTYTITGTPNGSGTASFALNIGGQSCTLTRTVDAAPPQYPSGSVFCASGASAVVNVTNPSTGRIWMDRNLGATQVATSSTDANSYGDLYQWGRRSDGHQCRNSPTTTILSSTDQPGHGDFILTNSGDFDWRSPQNHNLWQGVNGVNNPCPNGHRLPTEAELNAERLSWSSNNSAGAFASPLKLTLAGSRTPLIGSINNDGFEGAYWSSSVSTSVSKYLSITTGSLSQVTINTRAGGRSVRCIKD